MIRKLIAAVLACLYVAGSIWIVHSAGQTYRAGLSQTIPLAREIDRSSPPPVGEKEKTVPSIAGSHLEEPRSQAATAKTAQVKTHSAKRSAHHPASAPPVTEVARAKVAIVPSENRKAADPASKATRANPLANNAFWNQDKLTKVWEVAHLKPDDERGLRDDLHELIVRFNPLVEDPSPWLNRVEDAGDSFVKTLHRKEIKYKYFILDSDVVNAFSIPGGFVYISRGLFDLIGEDEDYALQFAIGHEMAHVDDQHAINCLRDPGVMKMTEGTLQKLFTLILPFGYLRNDRVDPEFDQEYLADEWVANRMQRLGRTRREILVFLQKLEGYSKTHGFYDGRVKPQPGHDLSPLENHYRAQTAARSRLKHLKAFMDQGANAPK
jgi:Peptidase family M48